MSGWGNEHRTFRDPISGAAITRLTDHRAHSYHLYFVNSGFWDGRRQLILGSERGNARNFYSADLEGGELDRMTDFGADADVDMQNACLNPACDELYFGMGRRVMALDLHSRRQRELYAVPAGYMRGNLGCTADGERLLLIEREDLTRRFENDQGHGHIGFVAAFEANPRSRILSIPCEGGRGEVLHEEECWLGHINPSPVSPHLATFCHEGPWNRVGQRIWVLNRSSGDVSALRSQEEGEAIGHEYWFADGSRVGYHGSKGEDQIWGFLDWDGSGHHEWTLKGRSMHFHSLDELLVVADGGRELPYLLVWKRDGEAYRGPRILARHRSSFHTQVLHPHPHLHRNGDGLDVLFTSDHNGYGNVFIVQIGDFEALPEWTEANPLG